MHGALPSLPWVNRGQLMRTCANPPRGFTLLQARIVPALTYRHSRRNTHYHAHRRFAGKSYPARGRQEPPPVACRDGRRDRFRARPIPQSGGDHRISGDPDRVARRSAQDRRRLHRGRVRDHEHGEGAERQGHRAAALLAGATLRLFFRKAFRLRPGRHRPRAAHRAAFGAVRKFPGTRPLDGFSHLRAADRGGDELVLRAVLRAGGPRICRCCGLLLAVALDGGDADHRQGSAARHGPDRSRGECGCGLDRASLACARRHDADDLAARVGTGRERSGLRHRPDRALPRADLFCRAFRFASQELLKAMSQRPIAGVPRGVLALLALGLAGQIALKASAPPPRAAAEDLGAAPSIATPSLPTFGDPVALAKALMLYLQAFDYQSGSKVPYRDLDYGRLEAWLARILELDPRGQYPLLAASRLYAEVPVEAKQRSMLEFIYRQVLLDPNRPWPWLAHATAPAKHTLPDLPPALRYAEAMQRYAVADHVPLWAEQMEIFILEDIDELETARLIIRGYVQSRSVKDPAELRFLEERLKQLEARTARRSSSGETR